jgi:hypothetical protein
VVAIDTTFPAKLKILTLDWAWRHTSVIPALGRLKQKDCKFEASLCYIAKPCLKKLEKNYLLVYYRKIYQPLK